MDRQHDEAICFLLGNSPGNYPEESIQHSEHGKSLKSRMMKLLFAFSKFVNIPTKKRFRLKVWGPFDRKFRKHKETSWHELQIFTVVSVRISYLSETLVVQQSGICWCPGYYQLWPEQQRSLKKFVIVNEPCVDIKTIWHWLKVHWRGRDPLCVRHEAMRKTINQHIHLPSLLHLKTGKI